MEIAKQGDFGTLKQNTVNDKGAFTDKPRTLSEIGLTAEEAETERQRREKQAESLTATHNNNLFGVSNNLLLQTTDPNTNAAATKLATTFNTNRTYINEADDPDLLADWREAIKEQGKRNDLYSNTTEVREERGKAYTAARLKRDHPEIFERVKSGEKVPAGGQQGRRALQQFPGPVWWPKIPGAIRLFMYPKDRQFCRKIDHSGHISDKIAKLRHKKTVTL